MAVAVAAAFTASCTGDQEPTDERARSPSKSDLAFETPVGLRNAPTAGTCWRMPPDKGFASDYWFDASPTAACTERHNSETVSVTLLAEPTVERAKGFASICWDEARRYVDVNHEHWIPWGPALYLPSKQQIASGESWFRCDVAFPADWAGRMLAWVNFPAADAATELADELLPCLDRDPHMREQPFVSCNSRHRFEATGQLAIMEGVTAYPSPMRLRQEADQCRDGLAVGQSSQAFGVTAVWDPPGQFIGRVLAGVCFVFRQDGAMLPPRQ
jgi:putative regulator of septum formation